MQLTKNEIWKTLFILPGFYEVSTFGNARRRDFKGVINLKPDVNYAGYIRVNLNRKKYSVHRLVALAFIPIPEGKNQVNHKDGNKANNHVDNLEWVTCSENHLHAYSTGLKKKENIWKNRDRVNLKVSKLVLDLETGIYFDSIKDAAKAKGYLKSTLTNYLNGNRKNKTSLILA